MKRTTYECDICGYSGNLVRHYRQHLETAGHKRRQHDADENKSIKSNINAYTIDNFIPLNIPLKKSDREGKARHYCNETVSFGNILDCHQTAIDVVKFFIRYHKIDQNFMIPFVIKKKIRERGNIFSFNDDEYSVQIPQINGSQIEWTTHEEDFFEELAHQLQALIWHKVNSMILSDMSIPEEQGDVIEHSRIDMMRIYSNRKIYFNEIKQLLERKFLRSDQSRDN